MKVIPPAIQAALDGGGTTLCTCWHLTLKSGAVFGFSDHDRPLTFDGVTYEASSGFTPSEVEAALGLAVSTQEVEGVLDSSRITEADIRAGLWNNAAVVVWLVDWSNVADRMILRTTSIGQIVHGSLGFGAEMRGLAHELNQGQGRTYKPRCDANFGDSRCGLALSDDRYRAVGSIGSSDGSLHLYPVALATVAGTDTEGLFSGGIITFTSGPNIGLDFKIMVHIGSGSAVHLVLEDSTPFDIGPGDTFTAIIGCDKRAESCYALFDNMVNFRGFNRIPGNDRAMQPVDPDDEYGNDGGSLFGDPSDTPSPNSVSNPYGIQGGFFADIFGGDE